MYIDILDAINEGASEIFSSMAFVDILPKEMKCDKIDDPITVQCDVMMPISHEMYFIIPKKIFHNIGKNIFPEDYSENNDEIVNDSACEFVNVLAGKFFQLSTPDVLFELSIPKIVNFDNKRLKDFETQTFITPENDSICIAHKLSSIMRGDVTKEEEKEIKKYRKIDINDFFEFTEVQCDVYIRLSQTKYVKIIKKSESFDQGLTDRYLKKGVKFFYINSSDFEVFTQAFTQNVEKIVSKTNILETKQKAIKAVFEYVSDQAQKYGVSNTVVTQMEKVFEENIKTVENDGVLANLINNTLSSGNEIAKISMLASYISAGMLPFMNINNKETKSMLSYASIFHDSDFKNIDEALIDNLKDPALKKLNTQKIINHTITTSELLRKTGTISEEVAKMIENHHEKPDGSGFLGKKGEDVSEMDAIFIIARDFVNQIFGIEPTEKDLLTITKNLKQRYNKGNFKKPVKALLELVRREL